MSEQGFQSKIWIVFLLCICAAVYFLIQIVTEDVPDDGSLDTSLLTDTGDPGDPSRDIVARIDSEETDEVDRKRVVIDDIDPSANEYMGIKGRIRDDFTNKPITNATMWYRKSSEGPLRGHLSAGKTHIIRDYKGVVRLYDLEPGTYSIAIKARGYETYFKDGIKVPQRARFHIFKMSRGTFIEGRVLTSDGSPAVNIPVFMSVELDNPEDEAPARRAAQTDSQGLFLFGGLPSGKYKLFVKSMMQPLGESNEIYLSRGGNHTLDLYMPPLHTVEFQVYDSFGSVLVNANIKFYEKTMKFSGNAKTDYYGKASFKLVPAGEYNILIHKNTYKKHEEQNYTILPGSDIIQISRALEKGTE